jgi:hypothetical protein
MLAKFRSTPGMMAPLGDVLHRGVVVDAPADQTLAEGMIYMAFTPPVTKMAPDSSSEFHSLPGGAV